LLTACTSIIDTKPDPISIPDPGMVVLPNGYLPVKVVFQYPDTWTMMPPSWQYGSVVFLDPPDQAFHLTLWRQEYYFSLERLLYRKERSVEFARRAYGSYQAYPHENNLCQGHGQLFEADDGRLTGVYFFEVAYDFFDRVVFIAIEFPLASQEAVRGFLNSFTDLDGFPPIPETSALEPFPEFPEFLDLPAAEDIVL
jgi:hypothetical protein